ncbi:MAG TPA: hypothetical protein VKR58_07260, partial [Aquella sp.]|nr:hypothetical protein [Aquella sp.]
KGVIHWVSEDLAFEAEVRLYDQLFTEIAPDKMEGQDFTRFLNPHSLQVVTGYIEPAGKDFLPHEDEPDKLFSGGKLRTLQFERLGYFVPESPRMTKGKIVFNKTVSLKDTWRK